jgi:hypothetical protein
MLPVYKYEPIKVIHFDIDRNKIETYLSTRDKLMIINRQLIPTRFIYDMLDDPTESRVQIRYVFRLSDGEEKTSFGSYISEQIFYIKYVNDDHTLSQIKHLFNNSHFISEQQYDKLIIKNELPKISFMHFTFPDYLIQELFEILKDRAPRTN